MGIGREVEVGEESSLEESRGWRTDKEPEGEAGTPEEKELRGEVGRERGISAHKSIAKKCWFLFFPISPFLFSSELMLGLYRVGCWALG